MPIYTFPPIRNVTITAMQGRMLTYPDTYAPYWSEFPDMESDGFLTEAIAAGFCPTIEDTRIIGNQKAPGPDTPFVFTYPLTGGWSVGGWSGSGSRETPFIPIPIPPVFPPSVLYGQAAVAEYIMISCRFSWWLAHLWSVLMQRGAFQLDTGGKGGLVDT